VELQERTFAWFQELKARKSDSSSVPDGEFKGSPVEEFFYRRHCSWRESNDRFDDWFNEQWPIWNAKGLSSDLFLKATSEAQKTRAPFDIPAMLLVGTGIGTVSQGWYVGILFTIWGSVRGISRFVVQKVDAEDREGLFRWAPAPFLEHMQWGPAKRAEIFNRLQHEVHVSRKRREGDPHYQSYNEPGTPRHKAMDPLNDYTPEKLFEDAMTCVAVHPRVLEAIGGDVTEVHEPDKVVYRVFEGIAEVYLGWRIGGPEAGAEIQVKATACLLDFIYVFPESGSKYRLNAHESFVIRPNGGNWSQNQADLHRYQKSPFGKEGDADKLYPNRSGVFEYDWETRDFKHGKEDRFSKGRGSM